MMTLGVGVKTKQFPFEWKTSGISSNLVRDPPQKAQRVKYPYENTIDRFSPFPTMLEEAL